MDMDMHKGPFSTSATLCFYFAAQCHLLLACMPAAGAASKGSSASGGAQEPAGSTPAPVAHPSEVSSFRMERRKRSVAAPPSVEPPATPKIGPGAFALPGALPGFVCALANREHFGIMHGTGHAWQSLMQPPVFAGEGGVAQ